MNEKKIEQKKSRVVRRVWIPAIKNLLSTTSDVVGDWAFYSRVAGSDYAPDLAPWLLGFSIVSTVLGVLAAIALLMNSIPVCININNIHKQRFQNVIRGVMLFEMFLEDIPQCVLTYIALSRRLGGLNGVAVFNITTSAFNFVFNGLDLFLPLEEEHFEEVTVEDEEEVTVEDYTVMN